MGATLVPLVGFLERQPLGGRWTVRNAESITVAGGPWRTRERALVYLVDDYQHRATARKRRG